MNKQAKTSIPSLFQKIIPRRKIAAIINEASLDEAVFIVAPYGCGKTLAALSWLKEKSGKAAWLTLDKSDDTMQTFFLDLAAALAHFNGKPFVAEDVSNTDTFLCESLAEIENSVCEPILVLDGLHMIHDTALLRRIKELVSALLKRWRIILISRVELPAVFNDFILKRRICLITLHDLNFNPAETAELFMLNGYAVSRRKIKRIHRQTEGWPAALNVILTLSRNRLAKYDDEACAYIYGFFNIEIWDRLDEETKSFLIKTSVLDRLTPAACHAVTDIGATFPILRRLQASGLFMVRLDGTDHYRYQRVFRDFLRYKLRASGVDERELYKKIAWRMFEREEFEQAFPYFFKSGDLYGLSRVLRIIDSEKIGLEKYLALTGCILTLNVDDLREYPLMVAKMASIHFAQGTLTEMRRLCGIFYDWIEPGVLAISPEEYAECVWEAEWLRYVDPFEPLFDGKCINQHSLALHHSRAAAYCFPSMLRGIRDYCPAFDAIDKYIRQSRDLTYETVDEELSQWRLNIVSAEYAYEREQYAQAEEIIKKIIPEAEKHNCADIYFACIALMVKLASAARNPQEPGALVARLQNMITKSGITYLWPVFHAFELRIRLADGIAGQTPIFMTENKDYKTNTYLHRLYRHITLVRALLSTGDYYESLILLGDLEHLCEKYNRIMDLIEINLLKAVANYGLKDDQNATRYIGLALDDARRYGFLRIFSDDAKMVWPVLALLDEKVKDDYIKNVVISCKKALHRAGVKIHRKDYNASALTKAEQKILSVLATDMSYKEIALDNGIQLATVKSHIRSIYSKLDVNNRASAVLAARSAGLMD